MLPSPLNPNPCSFPCLGEDGGRGEGYPPCVGVSRVGDHLRVQSSAHTAVSSPGMEGYEERNKRAEVGVQQDHMQAVMAVHRLSMPGGGAHGQGRAQALAGRPGAALRGGRKVGTGAAG